MIYKKDYFGYVYEWTNRTNNKKYIGSHHGAVTDSYIGSGIIFKKAYNKNPSHFIMRVLEYITTDDKNLTLMCEQQYLDRVPNIKNNKMYYNINNKAKGGWSFIDSSHVNKRAKTLKEKHQNYGLSEKEQNSYVKKIQTKLDRISTDGFSIKERHQHEKYGCVVEITDSQGCTKTYPSYAKASKDLGIDVCYGNKVCLIKTNFKGYVIKTLRQPLIRCSKNGNKK